MRKEYYKELIDTIVNVAWTIKLEHEKYKPYRNFRINTNIIMEFVPYADDEKEINGMIYYSYLLYLGCLYE
nr:MAG TPA: hypothetical protein [Caudoviricetes sp.]